jgi:hypothetical protein
MKYYSENEDKTCFNYTLNSQNLKFFRTANDALDQRS